MKNNENEKRIDLMHEKAKFFFKKTIAVHITTSDKRFYNGLIREISADFILIEDERIGNMPLFFSEILNIEVREPKVKGDKE